VHVEIPALADLLDLQDVDLEIDRLLDQRQNLPDLERYKAAHAARVEAEQQANALSDELKQMNRDLDKAEGELELTEIKLSETETRLYSGGMNARETENMRLDVQQLTNRKEKMEETVLELLDSRETLEAQLEEANSTVESTTAAERALEASIGEAWKEIDLQVGRFEARKSGIVEGIPEDLLARYEKLRRTKEGVAVGRLEHGQCGGCHLALSTTEQNEARETDPPLCVHCRRILVM
jgi:predicted  nucleic acid-binding Zn-ribbon protein